MQPLKCTVPKDLLELPCSNHRRYILRFESGLLLDPHLRKLARLRPLEVFDAQTVVFEGL